MAMRDTLEYLAIIPARGGSKRVPGKNIKPLNGKPLIAYTIEAAKNSKKLSRIIVSTDDPAIADCARVYGAEIPFMRPAEIAGDTAGVADALRHAVSFYESSGTAVKNIVLLQTTSPFREGRHIDAAIDAFEKGKGDMLTTVSPAKNHPYYALKGDEQNLSPFFDLEKLAMKSHELPPACYENGVVFVISVETLKKSGIYGEKNLIAVQMEPELTVDIDTPSDFALAEFLMKQRGGHA